MIIEDKLFGKYRINTDERNWIVERGRIAEDGKYKGEVVFSHDGYFSTLEGALLYLIDINIRSKNRVVTLKECIGMINDYKDKISELLNERLKNI